MSKSKQDMLWDAVGTKVTYRYRISTRWTKMQGTLCGGPETFSVSGSPFGFHWANVSVHKKNDKLIITDKL